MKPNDIFRKIGVPNPWLKKPTVSPKDQGWFHGNNREALEEIFEKEQPKMVLEIDRRDILAR